MMQDLPFAGRSLAKRPGFTVAALALLALGLGVNAALYTLLDAVFVHPLPIVIPPQTVAVYQTYQEPSGEPSGSYLVSYLNFLDLLERSRSFSELATYQYLFANVGGGSQPQRLPGMFVTAEYFSTLGLRPARGRFFLPAETRRGEERSVVVLGHSLWRRSFGGRLDAIGGTVLLNGRSFEVVGIAPRGFRGTQLDRPADFWVPVTLFPELSPYPEFLTMRGGSMLRPIGRLKPGIDSDLAEEELQTIARQLEREHPVDNEGLGLRLVPLIQDTLRAGKRERFLDHAKILAIATGALLVVALVNLANLLYARGISRAKELAIRRVLGAGHGRILVQLCTETALILVLGGLLSYPVAWATLRLLWQLRPPELVSSAAVFEPDLGILALAVGVGCVGCFVVALLPALRMISVEPRRGLQGEVAVAWGVGPWRLRGLLVSFQVALALTALAGAGLFLRSLRSAQEMDLGFEPDGLVVLTLPVGDQGYPEARVRGLYREILDRVSSLSRVEAATLSENRLLRGAKVRRTVYLEGRDRPLDVQNRLSHDSHVIVPGFFQTVGIPLLAGRDFDDADCRDCPPVVIVSRSLADRAWPGQEAIGQRLRFQASGPFLEVVGVVGDLRSGSSRGAGMAALYLPLSQRFVSAVTLHARLQGDLVAGLAALRQDIREVEPSLPFAEGGTLRQFIAESLWLERAGAQLLTLFGLLTLLLTLLGIHALTVQAVAQRQRELGLRLVLGAKRRNLFTRALSETAARIGLGLLLGWLAIALLSPALARKLPWIEGLSVGALAAESALLLTAGLLSAFPPARRLARSELVSLLREEGLSDQKSRLR